MSALRVIWLHAEFGRYRGIAGLWPQAVRWQTYGFRGPGQYHRPLFADEDSRIPNPVANDLSGRAGRAGTTLEQLAGARRSDQPARGSRRRYRP
jgi:hypothetical protein